MYLGYLGFCHGYEKQKRIENSPRVKFWYQSKAIRKAARCLSSNLVCVNRQENMRLIWCQTAAVTNLFPPAIKMGGCSVICALGPSIKYVRQNLVHFDSPSNPHICKMTSLLLHKLILLYTIWPNPLPPPWHCKWWWVPLAFNRN